MQQAQTIIKNSPQFRFLDGSANKAQRIIEPRYTVWLYQTSATNFIDEVILGFPIETKIDVGFIVNQLGEPCRVRRNIERLGMGYSGMVFFTWSQPMETRWILKPELTINQISILDTGNFCYEMILDAGLFKWHGFGAY
jgi:hypothetical protein